LSVSFCRCNGLLCGTYLKHLEVVPLFGTSFLGSVYQHRGQYGHSTLCGGHMRLGIPGVGIFEINGLTSPSNYDNTCQLY